MFAPSLATPLVLPSAPTRAQTAVPANVPCARLLVGTSTYSSQPASCDMSVRARTRLAHASSSTMHPTIPSPIPVCTLQCAHMRMCDSERASPKRRKGIVENIDSRLTCRGPAARRPQGFLATGVPSNGPMISWALLSISHKEAFSEPREPCEVCQQRTKKSAAMHCWLLLSQVPLPRGLLDGRPSPCSSPSPRSSDDQTAIRCIVERPASKIC